MLAEVPQAIVSGLIVGALYALMAVGLSLLFGVMEIVNFAHGEFVMVAMYVTFMSWSLLGLDPLASIPIAAVAVGILGVVIYQILVRRVLKGPWFPQIILTFGLAIFLRGLIQMIFTANSQGISGNLVADWRVTFLGVVAGGPQLVAATGAITCAAAIFLFLTKTELGRAVRAVSQDVNAARLMGIDPDFVRRVTWAISGVTVGVTGALLMNYYAATPTVGAQFGLVSFMVIGMAGFGSIFGAFGAGFAMGLAQTLFGLVAPQYSFAAIFGLFLLVIMIRPHGLFAAR